ncbi:methyltransferase FkbM domain-domain-containing protein [Ostreococcus tauri]|uniref:Methyltransferase FkbM domain-domain-containing protein n=1 Tax=Ostreococcus tauri TaxID=70448 RepID=A0A1Y5IJ62_OSTTA|nr:methyltransferase FkbM domain-domain-containing protein [Ostreococcus tauri]
MGAREGVPAPATWRFDRARRTATPPLERARVKYVSRADVTFEWDEIFGRACYADPARTRADDRGRPRAVIDVGANVGFASAYFAREVTGERGRVIALEPIPETFEALRCNAAALCGAPGSDDAVWAAPGTSEDDDGGWTRGGVLGDVRAAHFTSFPRAAGWSTLTEHRNDAETVRNLIEYVFDALKPSTSSSSSERFDGLEPNVVTSFGRAVRALVLDDDDDDTKDVNSLRKLVSHVAAFALTVAVRCVAAYMLSGARRVSRPVVSVSDVIDAHGLDVVDVLKIDVERAELDVLRGVSDAHWPRFRSVVCECHDVDGSLDAVLRLLRAHFADVTVTPLFGRAALFIVRASNAIAIARARPPSSPSPPRETP